MNSSQRAEQLTQLYELVTNYSLSKHLEKQLNVDHNSFKWFEKFKLLDSKTWKTAPEKIPYIAATTLIDSYSCLPKRPDMAFTYLWTAVNSCYNDLFLKTNTTSAKLTDTGSISNSINIISTHLQTKIPNTQSAASQTIDETIVDFAKRIPDKTLHFVATYLLKGIAIESHNKTCSSNSAQKIRDIHISSTYSSFKKRFGAIHNYVEWMFGQKYSAICSISEASGKTDVDFGISTKDKIKSRDIIHALGKELQKIIIERPNLSQYNDKGIKTSDAQSIGTEAQRLELLVFGILYASRNNNAHGNVASRINSIYANAESIKSATWVYLFSYFYLSLLLYCLNSILIDDLEIHTSNLTLLRVTSKTQPHKS
ncbi:hypothetical protein M1M11_09675 [Pseudomonas azerbaijanoccidens]|uniref:hypothetical protein n=1 Tax=Pseudomonas azerbaijanoccidentalis TaxID=2842347 RepID=UPI00200B9656|nr:hypothetical protein [Pseudomonas azerbaijanoccidentalis]MCK8665150.1 hypothetical protein [Pseudomonas azerbaijanoccidentalis]